MGVKLAPLVENIKKSTSINELEGKILGIDSLNTIYAFLARIRRMDRGGEYFTDSEGRVTSHLIGLFNRTLSLLEVKIQPVFVFDGKAPSFKKMERERRKKEKKKAEKLRNEALDRGDMVAAAKYAQATSKINRQILQDSRTLLDLLGVPIVDAPSEGEAQAAKMVSKGDLYGVCSQDFDSLLFGTPVLIRNLSVSQTRRVAGGKSSDLPPEIIIMEEFLESFGITQSQLIQVGLLSGTDFNPGVKGIGPKTALKLVKRENGNLEKLLKSLEKDPKYDLETAFPFDPFEIYQFFIDAPATDSYELEWGKIDEKGIIDFLCGERSFDEERVRDRLSKAMRKTKQTRLDTFFG